MQTNMMKAIIKPERRPSLRLSRVPIPTLGNHDVLIKVKAASICGSDLPIYEWDDPWIRDTIQPGQIIGHEFCGIVAACGKQVNEVAVGDFVTAEGHLNCGKCTHCKNGEAHICPHLQLIGFERPGAFAEYIAVPLSNLIRLDKSIPLIVGAILDAFGNAVHAAMKIPLTNKSVFVAGCGPVGLMAIALAKLSGAQRIFASDIRLYRLDLAKKLGADLTLNPVKEDVKTLLLQETSRESGVDVFFEMSGSPDATKQGFQVLKNGGHAVLMGLSKEPILFDFANELVAKGITVHGVVGRLMYRTWNEVFKLLDPIQNTQPLDLTPIVTHRLMIEDFEQGMDLMLSGQCGKVVLFMDEESLQQSYNETPQ